jgi:hypothetical protein
VAVNVGVSVALGTVVRVWVWVTLEVGEALGV